MGTLRRPHENAKKKKMASYDHRKLIIGQMYPRHQSEVQRTPYDIHLKSAETLRLPYDRLTFCIRTYRDSVWTSHGLHAISTQTLRRPTTTVRSPCVFFLSECRQKADQEIVRSPTMSKKFVGKIAGRKIIR